MYNVISSLYKVQNVMWNSVLAGGLLVTYWIFPRDVALQARSTLSLFSVRKQKYLFLMKMGEQGKTLSNMFPDELYLVAHPVGFSALLMIRRQVFLRKERSCKRVKSMIDSTQMDKTTINKDKGSFFVFNPKEHKNELLLLSSFLYS